MTGHTDDCKDKWDVDCDCWFNKTLRLEDTVVELKKIAARAINALDMFADQSRGKYADECRVVANELTIRYRAINGP